MNMPKYFGWNQLYTIINLLGPDNPKLNWKNISANPNITENIVAAHPDWPWELCSFADNKNIGWDFMSKLCGGDDNITYDYIRYNSNATWDKVNDIGWLKAEGYTGYINNPSMTLELYDEYIPRNRYRFRLLGNQSVSFDRLMAEVDEYYSGCVKIIRAYPKIAEYFEDIAGIWATQTLMPMTLDDVLADDEVCIYWLSWVLQVFDRVNAGKYDGTYVAINYLAKSSGSGMFLNYNITEFLYMTFAFRGIISKNPHISYALIKDLLHKWDLQSLVKNPALTIVDCLEIIRGNKGLDLMPDFIRHPFLTADVMLANPDLDWSEYYLKHSLYLYDVDSNVFESKYSVGDGAMMRYNAVGDGTMAVCDKFDMVDGVEYYSKKLNWDSIYITWVDIIAGGSSAGIKEICSNGFGRNAGFRMRYVARRCFDHWRIYAKHSVEVRENKAIYECCVHELNMRFRDVAFGVI